MYFAYGERMFAVSSVAMRHVSNPTTSNVTPAFFMASRISTSVNESLCPRESVG